MMFNPNYRRRKASSLLPRFFFLLFAAINTSGGVVSAQATITDAHGSKAVYSSDTTKSSHDWYSKWSGSARTLGNAGDTDPQDSQTAMSGSASKGIVLGSGESVHHPGVPRLYINKKSSAPGFENVEFTAYANWKSDGGETSNAGFTMVARTNHFQYKDNGCNAPGYYVRIWEGNGREGEISFQKEYYHASDTIYSSGIYKGLFPSFPKNQWIGMKFVVFTIPGTSDVQLEVYIDRTDGQSGGTWTLEHSHVDRWGAWPAKEAVPSQCAVKSGDTVLGARNSCVLRTDGGEVRWKKATIRNILTTKASSSGNPAPTRRPTRRPTRAPIRPAATPTRAPIRPVTTPTPAPVVSSGGSGTCGNGVRGNGVCANGQCCSSFGWCGTSSAHCTANTGGTCGGGIIGDGRCVDSALCCSQFGWCGTSSAHCTRRNLKAALVSDGNSTISSNITRIVKFNMSEEDVEFNAMDQDA
jgi:hypothetical protein